MLKTVSRGSIRLGDMKMLTSIVVLKKSSLFNLPS